MQSGGSPQFPDDHPVKWVQISDFWVDSKMYVVSNMLVFEIYGGFFCAGTFFSAKGVKFWPSRAWCTSITFDLRVMISVGIWR